MKFSVVIPCYNAGNRIAETLDSVAQQTIPAHEVIVIDDGSSDDSIQRVQQHGAATHHLRSDRRGPAGARNVGLANASGDAIAFVDADDRWQPEHLEKATEMLADSRVVACASNCTLYFEQLGKEIRRPTRYDVAEMRTDLTHDDFVSFVLTTGHFCQPSVVIKRSALGDGFDETLFGTEDIEFFMRVIFNKLWAYNPTPTVIYRADTPSSVSKSVVRQTHNKLAASKRSVALGYSSSDMKSLLARDARRAITAALTFGSRQQLQEVWDEAAGCLSSQDQIKMEFARKFRFLFRLVNQWRLSRKARNYTRLINDAESV